MLGNECESAASKIQRECTGRTEHSREHARRIFVTGGEQLADMLHLSIEALIRYIDAADVGI
jgi:hypothetical protein